MQEASILLLPSNPCTPHHTPVSVPRCDAAALSMRLGTGKGGLRLAPDELIPAILQVRTACRLVCWPAGLRICFDLN